MEEARIQRLEASFNLLAPEASTLVARFYERLFEEHPEARPLFPDDMRAQQGKLLSTLVVLVDSLRKLDTIMGTLRNMGARHVGYGVEPHHYPWVRDSLVAVMGDMAGDAWNETLAEDWTATLDLVSSVMLEGAEQAGS